MMKHVQKLKQQVKGPWNDEPDYLSWVDQDTSYSCTIRRGPYLALNGYVSVPQGHPLWGIGCDSKLLEFIELNKELTYSEKNDKCWVFGFDCAQDGDLVPGMMYPLKLKCLFEIILDRDDTIERSEIYRDINYVKEECRKLARQLKEKANNENS